MKQDEWEELALRPDASVETKMPVDGFFEFGERIKEARRDVIEAIEAFRAADMKRLLDAIPAIDQIYLFNGWRKFLRGVAKSPTPPDQFRRFLLNVWRHHGDHIRGETDDDLVLADALRVMLPQYEGPVVALYRGETFYNRRRRTYGLSWSRDIEVARAFARTGLHRTCVGGSVLLEATVPPEAVICEVPEADDSYAENEVIVDRRQLRAVNVLERFNQLNHDEYKALHKSLKVELGAVTREVSL